MYQFITKKENVNHFDFHNEDIIIINKKTDNPYLAILDNNLNLKAEIDEFSAYDFILHQNSIIATNKKATESYYLNIENSFTNIQKLDYVLHIKGCGYKDTYICHGEVNDVEYFLHINLITGKLIKKMPMNLGFGFVHILVSENLIISKLGHLGKIGVFTLDNQKIWEHNINNILMSDKKGSIRAMKIYNDNVIIVSELGYTSFDIATGKINWATEGYADVIEVVGNIGYVGTNHSLSKINLDTGMRSGYGWEYNGFPDFQFNGENYGAVGYGVVHHEGLLWYAVYSSGQSFIIAINPHDGFYEWILNIKEANKIDDLKFHNNRMYIRDVDNNLFVYEKDIA
jgi:hypothetical protein